MSDTDAAALHANIEFGNAGRLDTNGTGWFIGFSDWTRSAGTVDLRFVPPDAHLKGLCVKWFFHAAGDPNGQPKPVSEGRTMSILVGAPSEFRLEFSRDADFEPAQERRVHTLREPGDFVVWGEGIHHRAFGIQPACILTIRWQPQG